MQTLLLKCFQGRQTKNWKWFWPHRVKMSGRKMIACCFKANNVRHRWMLAVKHFRGESAVKVKNTNKTEKKSAQTEEKRLADRFNISWTHQMQMGSSYVIDWKQMGYLYNLSPRSSLWFPVWAWYWQSGHISIKASLACCYCFCGLISGKVNSLFWWF